MKVSEQYVIHILVAAAIVAGIGLAWMVRDVLLLLFGGLIIATLLRGLADGISRITPLRGRAAVTLSVLLVLGGMALTGWSIGDQVLTQIQTLREQLPQAVEASRRWAQESEIGSRVLSQWQIARDGGVPWSRVAGVTGVALGAVANTVVILAIGLYVAAAPDLYRRGLVRLFPPDYRPRANLALSAAANGLRLWLMGQLLSMIAVGVLTAIGLQLLNVPLALSLGIIAGLTTFIPFVGPLSFGVLAVLLAFTDSPQQALYVALLCLAIQQLEGYVITPLIQRRAVQLPPALGLIAVFIFGAMFGILGILLATPLMVVVMILVEKLYIEYTLEGREIDTQP